MKILVFVFFLCWFCNFVNGAVFDPYSRRYNTRNATFNALFSPSTTATTGIKALVDAVPVYDNERCKNVSQFTSTASLNNLVNFHHELIDLCPQMYQSILLVYKNNITTWGPIEEFMQIWYMRFVDALWEKIQARTSTCHCVLYSDFITAAQTTSDTALLEFLLDNYDPTLCEISDQTMLKWHLFLQQPQIKSRKTNFLKVGDFSIQLVQAIAKAYLSEARYNSYFEATPEYPILFYYNATLATSSYTLTQKGFFKQLLTYFKQQFPTRALADRQQLFSMKFSEAIDLSWSYYKSLNSIPLDPIDGITQFNLMMYICQKDFLKAKRLQYSSTPTTACVITTTTKKPSTTTTTTKKPTTLTTTTTPITTTTKAATITTTTKNLTTTTSSTTPSMTTTTTVCETTITTVPTTALTITIPLTTTTTFPTTSSTTSTPSLITTTNMCTTTTPLVLPTTVPCISPPNTAEIFIENGVVLSGGIYFEQADPVGTCANSPNGIVKYFKGETPADYFEEEGAVGVGRWDRTNCASPCICTSTSCYIPQHQYPLLEPVIELYPHCPASNQCFIAAIFGSPGSLVNPMNHRADRFSMKNQTDSDVRDSSYPKVTKIGCNGCPVATDSIAPTPCAPATSATTTTTSPICIPPSNSVAIFIENGVELKDDDFNKKADPIGICTDSTSTNGITYYYNGTTDDAYNENPAWVGNWDRTNCASPCICTSTSCYILLPGNPSKDPDIFLFPHCTLFNGCYIAAMVPYYSEDYGSLQNPLNATDYYDFGYYNPITSMSPVWPHVTKIGCSGCPIII